MFKKFMKRYLKNQRGLTLIELLATIVILGIISAIAVPAIGGLIDNSKKDAEVANATQLINSTKLYVTGHSDKFNNSNGPKIYVPLEVLYADNSLETMKDPFNSNNDYKTGSATDVSGGSSATVPSGTYVVVEPQATGGNKYSVFLESKTGSANYFSDATTGATTPPTGSASAVDETRLKRDFVIKP